MRKFTRFGSGLPAINQRAGWLPRNQLTRANTTYLDQIAMALASPPEEGRTVRFHLL